MKTLKRIVNKIFNENLVMTPTGMIPMNIN